LHLLGFTARPYDTDSALNWHLNRWYDLATGKWLSEDPSGFGSGDSNLYRYVLNSPLMRRDTLGLWGTSVHKDDTEEWAMDVGYPRRAAAKIAAEDDGTDSGYYGPAPWGTQSVHFDRPPGGADSRLAWAKHWLAKAKEYCTDTDGFFIFRRLDDLPTYAATELGRALHALQDWVAHGDHFKSNPGAIWDWKLHNGRSPQTDLLSSHGAPKNYPDDPRLDVVGGPDGRPAGRVVHEVYTLFWDWDYAFYARGSLRITKTEEMTKEALREFLTHVEKKGVFCGKCWDYFGVTERFIHRSNQEGARC